jgi:hypothetical protein
MKNKTVFLILIALAALVFSTANVMASPLYPAPSAKPTQEKTPHGKPPGHPGGSGGPEVGSPDSGIDNHDLKATERADRHATQQAEKDLRRQGQKLHFKGTVAGVTETGLKLVLADGTSIDFILTPESVIKIPAVSPNATWQQLLPGVKANVQAVQSATGQEPAGQDPAVQNPAPTLTVVKVLVIPGKPIKTHRVGLVTAYTAGASITIEEKDHKLYTYLLDGKTVILPIELAGQLAVGARVTVIVMPDPAGGAGTALGIVVHGVPGCEVVDPAAPQACVPPTPPEE